MKIVCLLLLTCAALCAAEDTLPDVREIRSVESYVPFSEFSEAVSKDPSAALMTLAEYRALVELATARGEPVKVAPPPPVETSLFQAAYTGTAGEFSVRFDATFSFSVAGDKWTRCDLGPIPNLSRVTLDDHPGWIVTENGRATLLVKGAGLHRGTLRFALPLSNEEDEQKLSAPLLYAATARAVFTVPGVAVPSSAAGPLDAHYDATADRTTFSVPVPPSGISLRWKRKFDSHANEVLLEATHVISYLPDPQSPYFYWQSRVRIARRKTDEVAFFEPPGCRIIRLGGNGIHSWARDKGTVRIVLDQPQMGEITFAASGILDVPSGAFSLSAPAALLAVRNTCTLELFEPTASKLNVLDTTGLRELPLGEQAGQPGFTSPRWAGTLAHSYFVVQPLARASVRVEPRPVVFDTRAVALLRLEPGSALLRCALAIQPERSRVFTANLVLPPEWKLTDLRERSTGRGLRAAPLQEGKDDTWVLTFDPPADPAHPVEFDVLLVPRDTTWLENPWDAHSLNVSLPLISAARRTESHIGIYAQPSIDIGIGETHDWRSDGAATQFLLGLASDSLRAGLATEVSTAVLRLELSHAPPRGEYESVLHVLALEHEFRVRADIRVLALDRARAVEELVLNLPGGFREPLQIIGNGVQEIKPGATANQRIVHFDQPWRGVRILRVEYSAPLSENTPTPVPDIRLEGLFDGRRRIVFQSAGVVSLQVDPGPGLTPAVLDSTPYFAVPFDDGRALFAFSFTSLSPAGTFTTVNLKTSPVPGNWVRDARLITILDPSGVARTHGDFEFSSSQQYVETRLPPGSRLLTLCVDGEPARPVRGAAENTLKIPLPPRRMARIELVYEQDWGNLGYAGSIEEQAPEFTGFPVIATNWSFYYPPDYVFEVVGGTTTPLRSRRPRFFAIEFLGPLFSGARPVFSSWHREQFAELSVPPPLENTASRDASRAPGTAALKSRESAAASQSIRDRSVGGVAIPEGALLRVSKLGGSAHVVLSYYQITFGMFAARTVFLLALLSGLWLMLRVSLRAALLYTVAGLLLGTLIPLALNWESPLLMIPFCEGLAALALLLAAAYLSHALARIFTRWRVRKSALGLAALLILTGCTATASSAETVLIPYPKEGRLPLEAPPADTKVYVPKSIFLDLMKRVKPEKKPVFVDAPRTLEPSGSILAFSRGNAEYDVTVDEKSFVARGTLELATYDPKGWTSFPLFVGGSILASVRVDGQPVGISNWAGTTFVELKGAHTFSLKFEIRGDLLLEAGRAKLAAQLIPGGATRVIVHLPAGAEPDTRTLPPGAWIVTDPANSSQRCELSLGDKGAFALSWHAAGIRGQAAPRLSSRSYTHFALAADGYAVARVEQIRADGAPQDRFVFRVLGDWEIAGVSAPGLAEWTVGTDAGTRRLRIWFHAPVAESTLQISGWAPLADDPKPAAGLSFEGALRQDTFIGFEHGGGRRFAARTLETSKRATREELTAAVALPESVHPDWILHFAGAPLDQSVLAELDPADTTLDTQYAAIVEENRVTIGARVRYTIAGRPPLDYQVELPPSWTVRTVRATSLRDWEVLQKDGKQRLIVRFASRAATDTELRWSAELPFSVPAQGVVRLDLPLPRALGDAKATESVEWILAAEPAFALAENAQTTTQPVAVERARRWLALDAGDDWRLAFRSARTNTTLAVDVWRQPGTLHAMVVTFVSPAEAYLQLASRIRYRIEGAGRDRFSIRLPVGAELLQAEGANVRGRTLVATPSGVNLTVFMQSPVSGEQILDLVYRLPRLPGTDALAEPPAIDDADARAVEHYAGLLPLESASIVLASATRLHPVENAESLPFVPANLSAQALAQVFSAEPGWTMTLRRTGLKLDEGQAAEARAEIVTTLASDGAVRSVASYTVRNRALQFLELKLPGDATLWAVLVEGRPVSVSRSEKDAAVLLIPLQRMTDADIPVRITVAYESMPAPLPALYTYFTPKAPQLLNAPVIESHWRVYVPEDYAASLAGGNVQEVLPGTLYGSRLDANIKEISRLVKIADAPGQSPARRQRALQSIAAEQQELSDNLTALGAEAAAPRPDAQHFSRDETLSQASANDLQVRLAGEWQQRLSENARKKQLADAVSGAADPEQLREFFDHFSFANIRWRNGILREPPALATSIPTGDMKLEDLRFALRFGGYRPGELPPFTPGLSPWQQTALPLDHAAKGAAQSLVQGLEGFDFDEKNMSGLRMTALNFRSVEVQPELTLALRSKSAIPRAVAIVALIAFLILGYALRRKWRSALL